MDLEEEEGRVDLDVAVEAQGVEIEPPGWCAPKEGSRVRFLSA